MNTPFDQNQSPECSQQSKHRIAGNFNGEDLWQKLKSQSFHVMSYSVSSPQGKKSL